YSYSALSDVFVSTRVPAQAGTRIASAATAGRRTATPTNVAGSAGRGLERSGPGGPPGRPGPPAPPPPPAAPPRTPALQVLAARASVMATSRPLRPTTNAIRP